MGPSGWAGVLMPSVDRVGRHFPLTVAVALVSHTAAARAVFEGADWFAGLEDAALAVLDPTRGADDLDGALAHSAFASPENADPEGAVGTLRALSSVEAFGPLAGGKRCAPGARARGGRGSGGRGAEWTASR